MESVASNGLLSHRLRKSGWIEIVRIWQLTLRWLLRLMRRLVAEDIRAMAVHKKRIKNLKTKVDGDSGEENRARKLRDTGCDVLDPARSFDQ